MKVLVTGGSGFLGSWVCELLSKREGTEVRALVRRTSNTKHLKTLSNVTLAEGSVEDARSVDEAAKGVDAVVHCAGLVKAKNEDELVRVNVQGTKNLVRAAKEHGSKRFVHVSSLEACGPSLDGSPVPVDQERPVTAYGRSKLAAEKAVLEAKDALPVVVLRPGAIYGPRDVEILEAFKSVKRGLMPTVAGGTAKGSFVWGPDCARRLHPRARSRRPERPHLLRRRRGTCRLAARDPRDDRRRARPPRARPHELAGAC